MTLALGRVGSGCRLRAGRWLPASHLSGPRQQTRHRRWHAQAPESRRKGSARGTPDAPAKLASQSEQFRQNWIFFNPCWRKDRLAVPNTFYFIPLEEAYFPHIVATGQRALALRTAEGENFTTVVPRL